MSPPRKPINLALLTELWFSPLPVKTILPRLGISRPVFYRYIKELSLPPRSIAKKGPQPCSTPPSSSRPSASLPHVQQ